MKIKPKLFISVPETDCAEVGDGHVENSAAHDRSVVLHAIMCTELYVPHHAVHDSSSAIVWDPNVAYSLLG